MEQLAFVPQAQRGTALSHSAHNSLHPSFPPGRLHLRLSEGAAPPGPTGNSLHWVFHGGEEREKKKMRQQQVGWEQDTSECCETEPPVNFV